MGWFGQFYTSSIGKKFVMALTGILLIVFLLIHLAGNLSLYGGESAFNAYAGTLESFKPIIRVIEVILALIFIFHIIHGVWTWFENKKAKTKSYAVNAKSKDSSIFSRTMIQSGSIIFIFLFIHLQTFWYPYNTGASDNLYSIVTGWFATAWYSWFYIFAMILLGFHLNHGFQSAFQTFGWNHKKYFSLVQKIGTIYAILMAVGFASLPIYFLFFHGGN
jgi:succinate dehydrogenase / fumarate reductase cytochrome b subunit